MGKNLDSIPLETPWGEVRIFSVNYLAIFVHGSHLQYTPYRDNRASQTDLRYRAPETYRNPNAQHRHTHHGPCLQAQPCHFNPLSITYKSVTGHVAMNDVHHRQK